MVPPETEDELGPNHPHAPEAAWLASIVEGGATTKLLRQRKGREGPWSAAGPTASRGRYWRSKVAHYGHSTPSPQVSPLVLKCAMGFACATNTSRLVTAVWACYFAGCFIEVVGAACNATIDGSYSWDLTPLCKAEGYHVIATGSNDVYDYWFNLCDNVLKPAKCASSGMALAYRAEQQSVGCQALASCGRGEWSYADPNEPEAGVRVLFRDEKGLCQLTVILKCDSEKPGTPRSAVEVPAGSCRIEVDWPSYYGCPIRRTTYESAEQCFSVVNAAPSPLVDYPVSVPFSYVNSSVATFRMGNTVLRYCLDPGKRDTANGRVFWVVVPQLAPLTNATVCFDSTQAAQGAVYCQSVFTFFDDFNGTRLADQNWLLQGSADPGGSMVVDGGILTVFDPRRNDAGMPALITRPEIFNGSLVSILVRRLASPNSGQKTIRVGTSCCPNQMLTYLTDTNDCTSTFFADNIFPSGLDSSRNHMSPRVAECWHYNVAPRTDDNKWYDIEIRILPDQRASLSVDGRVAATVDVSYSLSHSRLVLTTWCPGWKSNDATVKYDVVRVRKLVWPEPEIVRLRPPPLISETPTPEITPTGLPVSPGPSPPEPPSPRPDEPSPTVAAVTISPLPTFWVTPTGGVFGTPTPSVLCTFISYAAYSPLTQNRSVVCENVVLHLRCSSRVVHVAYANYGRRELSCCPRVGSNVQCGNPMLSTQRVKNFCEGRQECRISATNAVFGDPCYLVSKYLEVIWQCVSSPVPSPTPTHRLTPTPILTPSPISSPSATATPAHSPTSAAFAASIEETGREATKSPTLLSDAGKGAIVGSVSVVGAGGILFAIWYRRRHSSRRYRPIKAYVIEEESTQPEVYWTDVREDEDAASFERRVLRATNRDPQNNVAIEMIEQGTEERVRLTHETPLENVAGVIAALRIVPQGEGRGRREAGESLSSPSTANEIDITPVLASRNEA